MAIEGQGGTQTWARTDKALQDKVGRSGQNRTGQDNNKENGGRRRKEPMIKTNHKELTRKNRTRTGQE